MITASERAVRKLKETIIQKWSDIGLGFRVLKDRDDPSGRNFSIKLDNKRADDEVIELYGIKVFVDSFIADQLKDFELDYFEEPAHGFFFKKPNTSSPNCKS
jgi:Fe-S cluster assembly iron-binding protein IscA